MIVETDTSDYAIAGILSIRCTNEEIQLVAYYSWTLSAPELNYDTHNKELLAIHESFWLWCHYLEGSAEPVNIVTDHKNLKYFSTTKLLTWWQACWSEFLLQFNMVVHFRPRKLGVELCSALGWDLDFPRLSSYVSHARPVGPVHITSFRSPGNPVPTVDRLA